MRCRRVLSTQMVAKEEALNRDHMILCHKENLCVGPVLMEKSAVLTQAFSFRLQLKASTSFNTRGRGVAATKRVWATEAWFW